MWGHYSSCIYNWRWVSTTGQDWVCTGDKVQLCCTHLHTNSGKKRKEGKVVLRCSYNDFFLNKFLLWRSFLITFLLLCQDTMTRVTYWGILGLTDSESEYLTIMVGSMTANRLGAGPVGKSLIPDLQAWGRGSANWNRAGFWSHRAHSSVTHLLWYGPTS